MSENKKIIAKELYKQDPDKFKIFREYTSVRDKIINFNNKANLSVFQYLFGEEEGERLWGHFCYMCDRKYDEFIRYLVPDQANDLLVNIYYNEKLFII